MGEAQQAQIEELKNELEWIGGIANVCVGKKIGRRCSYCECDGKNLEDKPMAEKPRRVQLSRRKGWRMPENTVSVARPTTWGNPYSIEEYGRKRAILTYRTDLEGLIAIGTIDLEPLRGKNLARSDERRVGKECVRTCRSRGRPYH